MKRRGCQIGAAAVMMWAGLIWTAAARSQVAIQPAFVEVDLESGRPTGQFVITNVTDEEQQYRINARYFAYDAQGVLQYPGDDSPRSLAQWIRFNPTEFTMPPNSSRAVRFVIIPRGKPQAGEYWAAMSLEGLKARRTQMDIGRDRSINLMVSTTLLVPVFGRVGQITYQGELGPLGIVPSPDGPKLTARVRNTGTGRLVAVGHYRLLDAGGKEIAAGKIGHSYVMAGAERVFDADAPADLPAGRYTLEVSYKTDRLATALTGRTVIDWTPPPPVPQAPVPKPPAGATDSANHTSNQDEHTSTNMR